MQNISNGAISAFSIQLSKLLSVSPWPAAPETEHVIGLIEMTFPCLHGEGHPSVDAKRGEKKPQQLHEINQRDGTAIFFHPDVPMLTICLGPLKPCWPAFKCRSVIISY